MGHFCKGFLVKWVLDTHTMVPFEGIQIDHILWNVQDFKEQFTLFNV